MEENFAIFVVYWVAPSYVSGVKVNTNKESVKIERDFPEFGQIKIKPWK